MLSSALYTTLYKPEDQCLADLLHSLDWDEARAGRVAQVGADLVRAIRKTRRKSGHIESFFQQYALNTEEGVALMCLAEALLRIPDGPTASALIRDKVAGTNWLRGAAQNKDWMTRAAGLGLAVSGGTMNSLFSKLGEPTIRQAIGQAMKLLGGQFVIGQDIRAAVKKARKLEQDGYRLSYDMLGEGARTAEDAQRYFESYCAAIEALEADGVEKNRPGISVKLSALHPRYEYAQKERCVPVLSEMLVALCRVAAAKKISLTVDAEESERLDLSLEIFEQALERCEPGWDGFGLAVQAYQKRARPVLDHVLELTRKYDRRIQVRLVKGAYWDSEIKRAQVLGLPDYPVFTRKSNTDVSYIACAQKLLQHRDRIYPMFGTHNAHSVAAVLDLAGEERGRFEFQKLYGMGDALYGHVIRENLAPVSVYAPVGPHRDLLPYLVRRLLENGANSSFVNRIYDRDVAPDDLAADPVRKAQQNESKAHPKIPLPQDLYGDRRKNSAGTDLSDSDSAQNLLRELQQETERSSFWAAPLIAGKAYKKGVVQEVVSPADRRGVAGQVCHANERQVEEAFKAARTGHRIWSGMPSGQRAQILERLADMLEENRSVLMALWCERGREDCVRCAG